VAEAHLGRFRVERLPFYLAGIPTYVGDGGAGRGPGTGGRVAAAWVSGSAPPRRVVVLAGSSGLSLDYADTVYARRGDTLGCAGSLARAVIEAAHARLAANGAWALNEKRIVQRAGLSQLAAHFADLGDTPSQLHHAVQTISREPGRPLAGAAGEVGS
jgi:hypothetical protein